MAKPNIFLSLLFRLITKLQHLLDIFRAWTTPASSLTSKILIYLEQPRLQSFVEHDVEAEYLEADAVGAGRLSWPTHPVRLVDVRVGNDQGLENKVGYLLPQHVDVVFGTVEALGEVPQWAFTSSDAMVVLFVVLAVLVDWVIGQMHIEILLQCENVKITETAHCRDQSQSKGTATKWKLHIEILSWNNKRSIEIIFRCALFNFSLKYL